MTDDDDIQDYIHPSNLYVSISQRNKVLEEVALEIDKMKVFEADTMASIAAFIRDMKK